MKEEQRERQKQKEARRHRGQPWPEYGGVLRADLCGLSLRACVLRGSAAKEVVTRRLGGVVCRRCVG